jgi:uncharacterized membrane protein
MEHTIVGHFPSHAEAERAVVKLQKDGFEIQKLSIIGKDYQMAEHVRGFLTWKDTAKAGAFSGGYWGSFVGGVATAAVGGLAGALGGLGIPVAV